MSDTDARVIVDNCNFSTVISTLCLDARSLKMHMGKQRWTAIVRADRGAGVCQLRISLSEG